MRGLAVLTLVVGTVAVTVGLAVWWTARMLRRLRAVAVRFVDRGRLTIRARLLLPGAARQVAGTQLQLHTGLDQTRRVLSAASRQNCPLGDLPGVFRRIEQLAAAVDDELRMLDGDPDQLQRARLADAVRRSDELVAMAAAIRHTVSGVHADLHLDGLALLQRDLDVELRALWAGAGAVRATRVTAHSTPQ